MQRVNHSLNKLFNARSIAVIGASNNPDELGYALLDTIRRAGFTGKIYPINRTSSEIQGFRTFPSLDDAPEEIDLALILVPAQQAVAVLQQTADKGIEVAALLCGDFREAGRLDLENELERVVKERGITVLGPNIQGFCYVPNRLCAMFWPALTTLGPLAVISQSGSLATALADWAAEEGLGISTCVVLGNRVDLDESDVLEFLIQDPDTRAIALYLESVKDRQRFLKTAQNVAQVKPIAILKSGQPDEAFDDLCRQSGLVRTKKLQDLYDSAKALSTLKEIKNNRLFVLSTSGGGASLAVNEAAQNGLVFPPLPDSLVEELKQLETPWNAIFSNPLILPSLNASLFERVIELIDRYDLADVYLISLGDPVPGSSEAIKRLVSRVNANIVVAFYGGGEVERRSRVKLHQEGVPVYPTPERAVSAIAAMVRRGRYVSNLK